MAFCCQHCNPNPVFRLIPGNDIDDGLRGTVLGPLLRLRQRKYSVDKKVTAGTAALRVNQKIRNRASAAEINYERGQRRPIGIRRSPHDHRSPKLVPFL